MAKLYSLPTKEGEPFIQVVCCDCGFGQMTIWKRKGETMAYCGNCASGQMIDDDLEWEDE